MDHERQQRGRARGIGEHARHGDQVRPGHLEVGGGAVHRVGERDGRRRAAQPLVEHRELSGEVREALVAGGIGLAAREHALERGLRLDRDARHEREFRRHDGIQHDRARAVRVAPGVVLRHARAVGTAEQVDVLVAERGAHGVEVLHRDAGRVELRPCRERAEAFARELAHLGGRQLAGRERFVVHRAVEPVGAPGAALVHEHEVAFAPDAGEGAEDGRVTLDRALARAAGDEEQRIRPGFRRDGRDDRDRQRDLRALRVGGVFRHLELSAARLDGDEPMLVGDAAGFEHEAGGMREVRAEQPAQQEGGDQLDARVRTVVHSRSSVPAVSARRMAARRPARRRSRRLHQ